MVAPPDLVPASGALPTGLALSLQESLLHPAAAAAAVVVFAIAFVVIVVVTVTVAVATCA